MTEQKYTTPKQTKLLLNATKPAPESAVSAQALAGLLAAGWPDPLPPHIAAAIFMGCSYVMNLADLAHDAGALSTEESVAVKGVAELAMQIWKYQYDQANPDNEG
jgi:hypothetical protein